MEMDQRIQMVTRAIGKDMQVNTSASKPAGGNHGLKTTVYRPWARKSMMELGYLNMSSSLGTPHQQRMGAAIGYAPDSVKILRMTLTIVRCDVDGGGGLKGKKKLMGSEERPRIFR